MYCANVYLLYALAASDSFECERTSGADYQYNTTTPVYIARLHSFKRSLKTHLFSLPC